MGISIRPVVKPMLAKAAERPFDSEDYIYELKWVGTRCIAFVGDRGIRLQRRRLRDISYRYPELKDLHKVIEYH